MTTDLTKPTNHIYWLWAAFVFLAISGITAYIDLRNQNEQLKERSTYTETVLKVQLAEINARLINLESYLQELRQDFKDQSKRSIP